MKALKNISVKTGGVSYNMVPGCTVPEPVVELWKKNNQLSELIKLGSVSDDSVHKSTTQNIQQANEKK